MLEVLAKLLGVTGLVLGIFYLLYKQIITKVKLPGLSRNQAFALLVMVLILVWLLALFALIGQGGLQVGNVNIDGTSGEANVSVGGDQ